MRPLHSQFLLFLVLLFLIPSASAYSNDFSSHSMGGFTVVGSWDPSGGMTNNTAYAPGSGATITNTATHAENFAGMTYYHITMGSLYTFFGAPVSGSTSFHYSANSVAFKAVRITNGVTVTVEGSGTYTPVTITNGQIINIDITETATNTVVVLSTYPGNVLINTQTISLGTPISNPDRIELYNEAYSSGSSRTAQTFATFDNIIVSSVSPNIVTGISWGLSSYTVGDTPQFTWQITDSDWNSHPLQQYVLRLYKAGIMQDWGTFNFYCGCQTQLAVGKSGIYSVSADVPGNYMVTLELMYPFIGGNIVVQSSTVSVNPKSSSYFTIQPTALIKTNTTATYHIGVGGRTGAIDWYFLNNGIEEREAGKILTGTDGTVNITFSRIGTYNVYLKSITGIAEIFQMHSVVTSFIPSTPTNNFSTSSITLLPVNGTGGSNGNYHMNEVLFGNYSIKASVFANEGTFFLDIFNNDAQAITTTFYGSGGTSIGYNDFGIFALVISNNANDVLKTHWLPGSNSVRLRIQYPNGSLATLATDTFSLSRLTISGYGLDVTPLQVAINQPVTATATSPETNSSLVITGANGYSKTYSLPTGTTTLTTSFNQPGIYGFNLYSSFGYLAMSTQVTVTATAPVTPTPSTPSDTNAKTLDFISSGSFLALIIFVTIIGLGGALAGAVGFLVGTFASIPLLYLAGLIPLWVVFLDAGTVFLGLSIMIIHQLTKSS